MYGIRIKDLRTENNYTQESLAEKLGGVSSKTVGSWEREDRMPSIETIAKLADLFGVTTDYILGKTNEKQASAVVKKAEITDKNTIMTFDGKPIPEEDMEIIKRLLRGKE